MNTIVKKVLLKPDISSSALRFVFITALLLSVFSGTVLCGDSLAAATSPAEKLMNRLGCPFCHLGLPYKTNDMLTAIPNLTQAGMRFTPGYIYDRLLNPKPVQPNRGDTRMPDFSFSEKESLALTLFLVEQKQNKDVQKSTSQASDTVTLGADAPFSSGKKGRRALDKAFEKTRSRFPQIDAEMGKKIVLSQNCGVCHNTLPLLQKGLTNGPDLHFEGARVTETWLRSYLKKPTPVRPFGYYPGTGSRMPDFNLTPKEIETITTYLMTQKKLPQQTLTQFTPKKLSRFSMAKALTLLQEKYSCQGCHQLGSEGGKIGPDLSVISNRLQPSYLFNIIKEPHAIISNRSMPTVRMPLKSVTLLSNFLLQYKTKNESSEPLSLTDLKVRSLERNETGKMLYQRYCSSCHGISGKGNGYNARYINARPAVFTNKSYMATRPDDVLFDGISSGGYILNKSHLMPPWGDTLRPEEIKKIVRHIRTLCRCQGPDWSRDNGY